MSAPVELPKWADVALVPAVATVAAFLVAGLVVASIGESPLDATRILIQGSLGSGEGLGFTLYYATDFIFTGLAVAVAFHAGLFNIGAEGQATLGGLGATLVCLSLDGLPAAIVLPLGIIAAAAFGALWGFIPGYLQARRGSHVVITTIMLNFLAAILIVYLLVNVIGDPKSMAPETRTFSASGRLPFIHDIARGLGFAMSTTPLNLSLPLALLAAVGVWLLIYRSRLGYAIRTVGASPAAAVYAGVSPERITMLTMALSGALAAGLAVNEVMGVQQRLLPEFTSGYGFVGIAVALMGRAHPVGVVLAALLFGMLYQGGAELSFVHPAITRDMVTVIGGVLILFAGALDGLFRRAVASLMPRRAVA
ncbi:nucleoside ABC transporter membrane protein [Rhizobiales bacterium GAS191]|nr:nucleoside ABC transporter membrane protein [Rhizobiales bacterium GAS113]SEE95409.1 nucleoside ABC transporter membrane protein [Rhizobiales bacterium GAS191]